MSVTSDEMKGKDLNYRTYEDGDKEYQDWHEKIFNAGWSHKCPTYIQSSPPCQASCPAGEDIRGYLNIARGMEKAPDGMAWQEYAFRRLTEANPFPSVMGRVCPAPCESGCNRNEVDDRVGINSVEHFIGEYALKNGLQFAKPAQETGKKVAIIGGGPAGLAAAYQLRLKGHGCTIFDEHEDLGGMMRYGIPGFRTPRDVLDAEIQRIMDMGVEARLNVRVGSDVTLEQLEKDFDAIFVALGAQAGRPLPVPGAEAPNCVTGMAFLRAFNEGRLRHVGKRVVVIGGGDTSIDVATVARRLGHIQAETEKDRPDYVIQGHMAHDVAKVSASEGAEVVLLSRAIIDKMNANKHEIDQALAEGIEIRGGVTPVAVVLDADGRAKGLRVAKLELVNGKQEIVAGSEHEIEADLVVAAIGQAVDFTGLESLDNGKGMVNADKNYQVPGKKGYFVGGDIIRPHLLTTAIGHGSIAADGIDAYLSGDEAGKRPKVDVHYFDLMRKLVEKGIAPHELHGSVWGSNASKDVVHNFEFRADKVVIPHDQLFLGHFAYVPRHKREELILSSETVLGHFEERIHALSDEQAAAEAKRCMSCGMCFECDNCVVYCPQDAVKKTPRAESTTGRYVFTDYTRCIGCHICRDVCPTGYIQMGLGE